MEEFSMKTMIATVAVLFSVAGAAHAGQCPSLWAKAEEAMTTATLDDATKAKVTELITKGKADHEAGKHADSEAGLQEALKLLGA
jgi:hypothetical protein